MQKDYLDFLVSATVTKLFVEVHDWFYSLSIDEQVSAFNDQLKLYYSMLESGHVSVESLEDYLNQ